MYSFKKKDTSIKGSVFGTVKFRHGKRREVHRLDLFVSNAVFYSTKFRRA